MLTGKLSLSVCSQQWLRIRTVCISHLQWVAPRGCARGRESAWCFMALPESGAYYFCLHPHSISRNSIIWSQLFARKAGKQDFVAEWSKVNSAIEPVSMRLYCCVHSAFKSFSYLALPCSFSTLAYNTFLLDHFLPDVHHLEFLSVSASGSNLSQFYLKFAVQFAILLRDIYYGPFLMMGEFCYTVYLRQHWDVFPGYVSCEVPHETIKTYAQIHSGLQMSLVKLTSEI